MRRLFLFTIGVFVIAAAGIQPAYGKVVGKIVEYIVQGTTMKAYLTYDEAIQGKRPGILVVHEWWGLNDYARKRADMLAQLGYTALAVDMYGEGKTASHPDDAGKFSSELMKNFPVAKARFLAAEELLKKQPTVDPGQIGAVGYCFGGGIVLNMAAQGEDLKGIVSFHGSLTLVQQPKPGQVKAKILVLHGGSDKYAVPGQVEKFKNELKAAGADIRFVVYPDAMHAFTNPEATESGKKFNMPIAYNEKADKASWEEMQGFFKQIFNR
ncbi:MAG: dienelactone hydrolase [Nitrospirae bacterium GWD2_57_9]|nr:MAG: dienelactone hydrolase [Nitrospirae bacterium GWD2_57_9]